MMGATMTMRRNDYDVTNSIQVSSTAAVADEVRLLFRSVWPRQPMDALEKAFAHFERLFAGEVRGWHGVDTVYHDRQHTLDMTLALARLIVGHEQQHRGAARLGGPRAIAGLITGLFHDVGYLRRTDDHTSRHGAEFTRTHVTRSASFLSGYLPRLGLRPWVQVAAQIVHFTGYEVSFGVIAAKVPDQRNIKLGHLIGTADMIAQMSDRCYLEKCRDRLYAEFVLGGVALQRSDDGSPMVKYASGLDLLRQTPGFATHVRTKRLDGDFDRAYRHVESLYGGRNPYMEAIDRNLDYLNEVLSSQSWDKLRRKPPVFAAAKDPMAVTRAAVLDYMKGIWMGPAPPRPERDPGKRVFDGRLPAK
jgi:hypothetical protein